MLTSFGFGAGGEVAETFANVASGRPFAILQVLGATSMGKLFFRGSDAGVGVLALLRLQWCENSSSKDCFDYNHNAEIKSSL